ncbi:CRISPR-associated helicase Cas3' [Halomonas sp. E14]|uniref:CRISPR-associated helicase Cas3' n=1 Tax=Halomonas sp. E14 TaxID=3397245 RepID=UPI00403E5785
MAQAFSELPLHARVIWAKSGDPVGHGLLAHMLDVAAVAEALLEHEPPSTIEYYANLFGLSETTFIRFVAALAGLHDFGKAIPGFQAKWLQGQQEDEGAGLSFGPASLRVSDHACASAALLWNHLSVVGAEPSWVLGVLQAISAHHGYNFHRQEINAAIPPFEGAEWSQARKALFDSYWQMLAPAGVSNADELPLAAVEWLAGLTSVADWIGSNPDWFPLGERADSLAEHFGQARRLATQALQEIGWSDYHALLPEESSTDALICRIVNRPGLAARPLQAEGDRLLVEAQGPTLLLVEAPMGEGKTELAFLAHLRLQAANQHRGLYVALPTQATGNALFDRALTFLNAFGDQRRLDIQLVHGGAMLDERVQRLRGIHDQKDDSVGSAAWFSQRRRPLLSPYGVGTVDQALFATLNVKHHFVRLWGLANRVVVLDEVHAYDTYTSGLIESLLRWLKALGSSVVLMSATLPEQRRNALLQAWGVPVGEVPELPYPRLLLADSRGLRGATFDSRALPPISLRAIGEDIADLATCARQQLDAGGYGALIVNTVNRAQELYRKLESLQDEGVQLILFHARFPADERGERERQVLEVFGNTGTESLRPGRALLIATQVAEQSLDIDFDFLITDLAPVDLVLQRAGRLHRHRRVRPEVHAEARLFVAGLHPQELPELKDTAWEFVYEPYILGRTWALLSREQTLQLPHDIDRLVQAVYGDAPLPEDLQAEALAYIEGEAYGMHRARLNTERQQSLNIALTPEDEPQYAYLQKPRGNEEGEGLGLTNRTRLGDDAVTLVPVYWVAGGWSVQPGGEAFDPQQSLPDALARQLYGRQLKLSRKAVVAHFAAVGAPPAFAEHPLLRHLKPLELQGDSCIVGKLSLRLDERQGLVYESAELATLPED